MQSTESSADRFSRLFDLARDGRDAPPNLSPGDREEFEYITEVLNAIDQSWRAEPATQDRVRMLFLQRLAADRPDHPWVAGSIVRTLGDLIRATDLEGAPTLPTRSLDRLAADATPLAPLLDRTRRPALVGEALRRADVPRDAIGEFFLWFNRALGQLFPKPGPSGGMLYARRQAPGRAPRARSIEASLAPDDSVRRGETDDRDSVPGDPAQGSGDDDDHGRAR